MIRTFFSLCFGMLLVVASSPVFATFQARDQVVINGKAYVVENYVLDPYLEQHNIKIPMTSTANWRGYTATWELTTQELLLSKLVRPTSGMDAPDLAGEAFPGQTLPLRATWFSGVIIVRLEDIFQPPLLVVGRDDPESFKFPPPPPFLLAQLNHGVVVKHTVISSEEFGKLRRAQFKVYQKTDTYKKKLQEHIVSSMEYKKNIPQNDPLSSSEPFDLMGTVNYYANNAEWDNINDYLRLP